MYTCFLLEKKVSLIEMWPRVSCQYPSVGPESKGHATLSVVDLLTSGTAPLSLPTVMYFNIDISDLSEFNLA